MKAIAAIIALYTLLNGGCRFYKQLEKLETSTLVASLTSNPVLFGHFQKGINSGEDFISLDSCRKTIYEIKAIKGPFFSDHRIRIDKKWYSLNLSTATPILLFQGNIYYPEKHHYQGQKVDSLIIQTKNLDLIPCSKPYF